MFRNLTRIRTKSLWPTTETNVIKIKKNWIYKIKFAFCIRWKRSLCAAPQRKTLLTTHSPTIAGWWAWVGEVRYSTLLIRPNDVQRVHTSGRWTHREPGIRIRRACLPACKWRNPKLTVLGRRIYQQTKLQFAPNPYYALISCLEMGRSADRCCRHLFSMCFWANNTAGHFGAQI